MDQLAAEYGWSENYILGLTIAKLRGLFDAITRRKKNEYRASVLATEWSTRNIVQAVIAAAGASASDIEKAVNNVKFPWVDEDGNGPSEKPSDEAIIAAGGDPDNEFWFIETGDLTAADKNAGKSIDGFALSR